MDDPSCGGGSGSIIEEESADYMDFVAKYHGDAAFKKTVDTDPAAALRSEGIPVPDDVEVRLLSSEENVLHIVLPPPSAAGKKPGAGSGGR